MKCKICEKEFELKKEEKYLATEKVAAFGTLAKLPKTFEAFDCPHCGCQNIVNIREKEATDYDVDKVVEQLSDRSTLSRPVDWSKVAVDTPILVRDNIFSKWAKRYFAKYENGRVYVWNNGSTSWSGNRCTPWKLAKLPDKESGDGR